MCQRGIYQIIELNERYNFAYMTFDLEGQGQGQIVKRLFFCEMCDVLCAKDNSADTFHCRDPIFYPQVAHEWVSIGCQKNFDRSPLGEMANFFKLSPLIAENQSFKNSSA